MDEEILTNYTCVLFVLILNFQWLKLLLFICLNAVEVCLPLLEMAVRRKLLNDDFELAKQHCSNWRDSPFFGKFVRHSSTRLHPRREH